MIKILIVEDEKDTAEEIQAILIHLNYKVTAIAENFDEVMIAVQNDKPHVILMDINLRRSIDGIEISKIICQQNYIPTIFLTSFTDKQTIQRAVKTNPVGYLMKPLRIEELEATILLAIEKLKEPIPLPCSQPIIHLGHDFYYQSSSEHLFYKESPIKLSKKELLLLQLLINARGNIVSYSQIEYHLWPDKAVNNDALRALVYRLRSKLNFQLIETIATLGYKMKIVQKMSQNSSHA